MTDFTILSRYRNKKEVEDLIDRLKENGKTCYSFVDVTVDPNNPDGSPEEQTSVFESKEDFFNDDHFTFLFEKDLKGLKEAQIAILLLPAGTSSHIEIGIAFGLGKRCILIGKPAKPESLYLLFDERYDSVDDFIQSLK